MRFLLKYKNTESTLVNWADRTQFLCLFVALLIEFLFFAVSDKMGGLGYLLAERYMALPAIAFLVICTCRNLQQREKKLVSVSVFLLTMFIVIQFIHQMHDSFSGQLGTYFGVYALGLPFAAAAQDGVRKRGLKWTALLFVIVGTLMTIWAALLILDAIPTFWEGYAKWEGARLHVLFHPNPSATLFMISSGILCCCAVKVKKGWVRIGLLLLALIQFGMMALTNARTTIIFYCLLIGGIAFCAIRGEGWKRILPALTAAAVIAIALYTTSEFLYQRNFDRLQQQAVQNALCAETEEIVFPEMEAYTEASVLRSNASMLPEDEEDEEAERSEQIRLIEADGQRDFSQDLKTFNGRTDIWAAAVRVIKENPHVFLFGTEYVELFLNREYSGMELNHAHNSWLQVLLRMGILGLISAMILSVAAIWYSAVTLWHNTDLWKSFTAMLVLCLLACGILEPYLFTAYVEYHYLEMLFMMCLGYLFLWCGPENGEQQEKRQM